MQVNAATISHLEAFTKYARFIGDKFGIEVRFDGTKAQTDGKVIYLPSLAGLSEDEIDFLYCVLLHEVGHIRYSLFSPESAKDIKSQAHFHICNALEDARIENLLMKDFDGAHDIFIKLYNHYTSDDQFMHRVFGIKNKDASLWDAIGIYSHDYLIHLNQKNTIAQMLGNKTAKQVAEFVQETKLDKLLETHPLKTWDDVVELGTKIYKLFFKETKDKSEKVDITPLMKAMEETAGEGLNKLQEITDKMNDQIKSLQEKAKELEDKIRSRKAENAEDIQKLEEDLKKLKTDEEHMEELLDIKSTTQKTQDKLSKYQQNKEDFTRKQQAYADKQKTLEEQLQQNQAPEGQEPSKKQQDLEKKLATVKERIAKLNEKQQQEDQKITKQQQMQTEASQQQQKFAPEAQQLTPEQLSAGLEQIEKQIDDLEAKLDKLRGEGKDEEKLRDTRQQINQIKEQSSRQLISQLQDMQEVLNQAGLPIQVIPQFEKNEAWPEGDGVQQDFDQQATQESGQMVNNGCGFGLQSPRDIVTYIDQVKEDVVNFDLAEHFYESNHESKLETFNEVDSQINYTKMQADGKTFKSKRKHIPLSTSLDKLTVKNFSDGKEIAQIKNQLGSTITQVRNLFRNRLKFDKRDFFHGNQEEGRLDSRSLWKLATKTDELYYEVNRPKFVNKVSASIVVDISGSMDKEYTDHGNKLRELALILSEGLKEVHIQHEILGYHAPVSHELRNLGASPAYNRNSNILEHVVYKTFTDRNNLGVQNLELQCSDNSDGESIRFAAQRLIKSRSKRKVMFIISDGKPFLSDANAELLDQDLRTTLEWCQSQKIEVFALGFNEQGKEFFGNRFGMIRDYQDLLKYIKEKL